MSQLKFGERYFATRERIADVIRGIGELARDTSTDLEGKLAQPAIDKDLGAPFLFVVCGEVNAGKSSLINSLFGRELCKVNILPETDKVIWYRYGAPPHDLTTTSSMEERYRPIEFLRDFNLVDTPGTNSIVKGHQEITERFIPVADLILFVFPVTNPWGAATWNLISNLPKECHSRVAFVIQQSDQREAGDTRIITEHMADLSMKRIGIVPHIFAVSAKMAMAAKRAEPLAENEFQKSGFPALEQYISRRVCDSPQRRAVMQTWKGNASSALRKIEDHIEDKTRILNDQNNFLAFLEGEIDAMRESLVGRVSHHLAGVAEVFEKEAVWVTRSLRKWLGVTRSVFRVFAGDRTGNATEALFIERLRFAVEAVAESDGADIVEACRSHWQDLGARVKEAIGTDINEDEPIDERLEQARRRFVERIGRAAHVAIGNLHVRKELERELRQRNLALKSFTATTLILLIFAALSGIFGYAWLPWIFCVTAGLFVIAGSVIAHVTRRKITLDFQKSLLDTCGAFADTLMMDYEEALRIFFQDYTACLNSIRKHLANQKLAIEPHTIRWQNLFLTLKSIEQDD